MAGFGLPTDIDSTHPDDPSTPAVAGARKLHQSVHDALHRLANRFDDVAGSDYRALLWRSGLWAPSYLYSAPEEIVLQSGTDHVPTDADPGRVVHMTSASANTVTLPSNSVRPYPVGTRLRFKQMGAGQTRIVGSTGVTVLSVGAASYTVGQYAEVWAHKTGTNEWVLGPVGALTATPAAGSTPPPSSGTNTVVRPTATVTLNPSSNPQAAFDALAAGAVAKLNDGDYGATSVLMQNITKNGTTGSPITLMGNASNPGAVRLLGPWALRGSNWRFYDLAWDGPTGPNSGGEQSPTGEQGLCWVVGDNIVLDNVIVRDSKYNYGLFVDGDGVTLSRSWIYNNGDWSNPTFQQSGGIAYNLHQGVYVGTAANFRSENNVFEHNLAFGLQFYGNALNPTSVNDTFIRNGYGSGQAHAIVAGTINGLRMFNAIFHTSPGYAVKHSAITGGDNIVSRSLSYNNPSGYQSGTGISYVDNLNTADPLLTSITEPADPRLLAGSPAIGAGLSSLDGRNAPTIDRLGVARVGLPDLGAYERVT